MSRLRLFPLPFSPLRLHESHVRPGTLRSIPAHARWYCINCKFPIAGWCNLIYLPNLFHILSVCSILICLCRPSCQQSLGPTNTFTNKFSLGDPSELSMQAGLLWHSLDLNGHGRWDSLSNGWHYSPAQCPVLAKQWVGRWLLSCYLCHVLHRGCCEWF